MTHGAAVLLAAALFSVTYDPFHVAPVAFLALAPLVMVFSAPSIPCSLPAAAGWGFVFGMLASMGIVGPWMTSAAEEHFGYDTLGSLLFALKVNAAWVAAYLAPAFVVLRLLANTGPMLRIFAAASTWIAFEGLRAAEPSLNAWALLGQGLGPLPVMREAAAFGGVWLLGWFAALSGAAAGVGLQPGASAATMTRATSVAFASPVALVLMGALAGLGDDGAYPLQPLRVAAVQTEIPGKDLWNPALRLQHLDRYFAATSTLEAGKVDLVVWPESAVPFLLDADAQARERISGLATQVGAPILLGAPRSKPTGAASATVMNSAWLFPPGGLPPQTYDKRRLLPLVEADAHSVAGSAAAEYGAGATSVLFTVGPWRIAPLVCFEAIYPEFAAEAVERDAHLIVNISNDAWFAAGAGPEQHYAMSALRAVEVRRPLVRVANGGISAAVGVDGEPIGMPIRREAAVRVWEIPAPPRVVTTAATSGDWVVLASAAIAGLAVLLALLTLFVARREESVEAEKD